MGRTRPLLFSLIAVLLLGASGCGGNQISADEVTSDPPALELPEGGTTASTQLQEDAGSDDEDEPDEDATPTPTPTASGGTAPAPAATPTPAPATGGTQPQQQAAPEDTGGATADEGLDQFCADNPGAC